MKVRTFEWHNDHLALEFEQDECPALVISEADFTPQPLYVYQSPTEAVAEFRKIADWLDSVQKELNDQP